MTSVDEDLLYEVDRQVATITLTRPEKRNSFTDEMVVRWIERLDESERRDDVAVILVTGSGGSFSAGGDMGGLRDKADQTPLEARERMISGTQALVRRFTACGKPTVAAVNGAAIGGGMDVALLCDVRLASSSARFCENYGRMGLAPGVGGAFLLPRLIGPAAALDMFWTARWVDADEALRLGLVSRVFPDERFEGEAVDYARTIAGMAPLAVRAIKQLVWQGLRSDFATHLDALASQIALLRTSEDHREAVAAFREKRSPEFKGR